MRLGVSLLTARTDRGIVADLSAPPNRRAGVLRIRAALRSTHFGTALDDSRAALYADEAARVREIALETAGGRHRAGDDHHAGKRAVKEDYLNRELRTHLDIEAEEQRERGLSADDTREQPHASAPE